MHHGLVMSSLFHFFLLGYVWLEGWKNGKIKNDGMVEKWEDRKDFNFSFFSLIGSKKTEE